QCDCRVRRYRDRSQVRCRPQPGHPQRRGKMGGWLSRLVHELELCAERVQQVGRGAGAALARVARGVNGIPYRNTDGEVVMNARWNAIVGVYVILVTF